MITEVLVSFSPQAAVDEDWNPVNPADWRPAHSWATHPDYVDANWPLTWDYGLLFLDDPVQGVTPADLPAAGLVADLIGDHGQTAQRFSDVGYGQNGVLNGGGPPVRNFTWTRKVSVQRYAPGNGSASGILHPAWFILGDAPSANHGGGCGGDSGLGIFPTTDGALHDTVVAVHVGGYRLGLNGVLCGRITALNMRVDLPRCSTGSTGPSPPTATTSGIAPGQRGGRGLVVHTGSSPSSHRCRTGRAVDRGQPQLTRSGVDEPVGAHPTG